MCQRKKNPAAVSLGRRSRRKLTPQRRREIAKMGGDAKARNAAKRAKRRKVA